MIDLFAQQQPQYPRFATSSSSAAPPRPLAQPALAPSYPAMESHSDAGAQQPQQHAYGYQPFSSPAGPGSSRTHNSDADVTGNFLPHQSFSSPTTTDRIYPASTLAAVEATRARFFAQQSGSAPPRRPATTRSHKSNPLSSSSYRQSFFDRCQRAMHQSRSTARGKQITALRKGVDAATPGLFSDEMVMDEDEVASSPPQSDGVDEDDELTRHRILTEYSRLKRIYELKGQLEIGWIDPDQLEWLESEVKRGGGEEMVDPWWAANDEDLEALWRDSLSQRERDDDDEFDDAELEEELARLPL